MAGILYNKLKKYSSGDMYPFHMPGHKRNPVISYIPSDIDITEIDGFDNLHHAEGILKNAMEEAAEYYGARRTWYLVNGSTSGLLIAISAAAKNHGGTVVMARNCHKAAYHAAFLNRMKIKYVYPDNCCDDGKYLSGSIPADSVLNAINSSTDVKAVVITSPTYDGVVSDIASISEICHKKGIPLIIDEAHGAHFVLHEKYANQNISALHLGADVVIHSLHKTLPSMTQTALMHLQGDFISETELDRYSSIYQTSSPSYVMMAGIDSCIDFLKQNGREYFENYQKNLKDFYDRAAQLKNIKVYINNADNADIFYKDNSKILIFCGGLIDKRTEKKCDGQWLYEELMDKYHLQMEMSAADYVLALTSIMDMREGFDRLYAALSEIDSYLISDDVSGSVIERDYDTPGCVYNIYEALNMDTFKIKLQESAGKVSAEYIYLYPPGCPLVVPGERISSRLIEQIEFYKLHNYNIEGLKDKKIQNIEILIVDK